MLAERSPPASWRFGGHRVGLLPKPKSCRGCPAYGDGQGFVSDELRSQAQVVLYGQGPGADEEMGNPPAPFLGKTGAMLERTFLPLAGLSRDDVSLANSIRCRWNHRNDLPPLVNKDLQQAIRHCTLAHWRPPEGPGGTRTGLTYVVMGEYAFYALTGLLRDFSGWRGYLVPKRHPWESPQPMTTVWTPQPHEDRVLVTHHLAYLFREPTASLPAKRDWNKLAIILKRDWPVKMSPIETNPEKLRWVPGSAYDTEFHEDTGQLVRFSVANPDRTVFVIEWEDMVRCRGEAAQAIHRAIPQKAPPFFLQRVWRPPLPPISQGMVPPVLPTTFSQMGEAEVPRTAPLPTSPDLSRSSVLRLRPEASSQTRISQGARGTWFNPHHIPGYGTFPIWAVPDLQGASEVGGGSLPCDEESAGPTVQALQYWDRLLPRPTRAFDGGDLLPLHIIGHHVVVDLPYLAWILPEGTLIDADCTMYAHATLWSGKTATEEEKAPSVMSHTLNFLGSLYALTNRWKHLARVAPRLYAGGDAMGTMDVWDTGINGGLKGELQRDPETSWVYENLQKPLISIVLRHHQRGIAMDPKQVQIALADIKDRQDAYTLQAQAYTGWPINLRSPKHLAYWLYTVEGLKPKRRARR